MTTTQSLLPESQVGPAEKLLDLVLSSGAHLWHNRMGKNVNGTWQPAIVYDKRSQKTTIPPNAIKPGLFAPAAEQLYLRLLEIYHLNAELMAHFASYAIVDTEWRDLKVACAALMLVQSRHGQPILGEDGHVAFHEDDYREIGEAMLLYYDKKSPKMMTPKSILRVAELLETKEISELNRKAGFGSPASRKPPLGRWAIAARKWLLFREENPALLQGLVKAGYKETIKAIARKAGYKPQSPSFFETLGWKQKQSEQGHREIGLSGLKLQKRERFDELSEEQICEKIIKEKLSYKDVVGRLPQGLGLTPAIMVTLLPSLSDRDLRILTPTLEELGLLNEISIRTRWEKAIKEATDQRALNISKNVKSKVLREKLEEASDAAAQKAVKAATQDLDLHVMFLIDKSGSMEGAIEKSKEALSRILAGFPMEKTHIATFDTMGTVLKPKAASRTAIQHMLSNIKASGGTVHGAAVRALHQSGVRIANSSQLIVIVVGDEAGEGGDRFANTFTECGYQVSAIAFIVSTTSPTARGNTVRRTAAHLQVPFSEVAVEQFDDPYQVTRVLQTLLDAPTLPLDVATGSRRVNWLEKVMKTPLLTITNI